MDMIYLGHRKMVYTSVKLSPILWKSVWPSESECRPDTKKS